MNGDSKQTSMPQPAEIRNRAELHLCLGQAFLPPLDSETEQALAVTLPEDLEALNGHLGFTASGHPGRFAAAALVASQRPGGLKQLYSRLFLAPPFPAAINAGIHLDGSLMGNSVLGMEEYYLRHGLEKDKEFKDLPDHLALQLQFVGYLLEQAAKALEQGDTEHAAALLRDTATFETRYVGSWLPLFIKKLEEAETEYELPAPYRFLAEITLDAVSSDLKAWTRWPGPLATEEDSHAAAE